MRGRRIREFRWIYRYISETVQVRDIQLLHTANIIGSPM